MLLSLFEKGKSVKKRFFSLTVTVLSLISIVGCSPAPLPDEIPAESQSEGQTVTFCAMSDIHMECENTVESFTRAMRYMSSMQDPPDAYLFSGDLTDAMGSTLESGPIETFKSIYESFATPSQMMYCLGSTHDVPYWGEPQEAWQVFKNTFGDAYYANCIEPDTVGAQGIRMKNINGYSFFSLDWDGSTGNGAPCEDALSWLEGKLSELYAENPNKPVFVISHNPEHEPVQNLLGKFPQVIWFSGHLHNSVAREDSISQDLGCTRIHCGGQNYYRINGYDETLASCEGLGNIYEFGQAIYVQVDGNYNVTVMRIDTYNGVVLNNMWTVNAERRNVYTVSRAQTAEKCVFESGDVLQISKSNENSLTVSFDACKSGGAGPVLYYRVKLFAPNGDGVYTEKACKLIASQQVFYPNDVGIPSLYYSCTFSELDCLQDYGIEVTATDCWNTSENALVYTNGKYVSEFSVGGTVFCQ